MPVRFPILLAASILASPVAAQGLDEARALFEQAQAESDPARRVPLLESSIAAHETFEARLALGDALLSGGETLPARAQFKRAIAIAADDKARAQATFMVAESFLKEGDDASALPMLEQAAALHPYPVVYERLKAIERQGLDRPVPADQITRALTNEATRAFGVKPTVNLRIGFALNEATLDEGGRRQAEELGKALEAMGPRKLELVGHTDKQGDADYNRQLSLRRAEAVKAFLVERFGLDASAIATRGMGESQLLYPGNEPEDHALNRRVEVQLR